MKVVSLFSGCGGGDLGLLGGFNYIDSYYEKLPFSIELAVDNDTKALNTYNENFNSKHIVNKDIRDLKTEDLPNDYDILLGGFPCQSFSTVNPTKDPFDERGVLYKEMLRLLKSTQPKFFIAENVKGFMTLKKGSVFKRFCRELKECGYNISYQLVNAADYGVPQKRERVFIIGVRNDLNMIYEFPDTTHSNNNKHKQPWVALNRVIDSLVPEDPKYYFSKRAVEGMKNAKKNMKRGLWQDLNGPCLTITSHLAKVSLNSRDPVLLVKPEEELYRRFTPREAARIQSFPDTFNFIGSQGDAYRQIGNAIAPVVMWHLAKALLEQFNNLQQNLKSNFVH